MFRSVDRQRCQELFHKYYAGRKFHDDLYRSAIRRHLQPGQRLLDAGCGRYLKFCREFSTIARVTGIDIEPVLETHNATAPFGVRGDIGTLPFPSTHFDMIISRSVVEHLEDPDQVFREFYRVLRPGGKVVLITPNKYDYVSLIAAFTPYWVHRTLVSRIFQVPADDVFPTLYRANTISSLRKALLAAGFESVELEAINHHPAYLSFSPVLYRLGILYERLTLNKHLAALRGSLLCIFQKNYTADAFPAASAAKKTVIRKMDSVEVS